MGLAYIESMNIDWIANWRMRCEKPSKTAEFRYMLYYDMIWTSILNWSDRFRVGTGQKTAILGGVWFLNGVKPIPMVLVQVKPGTGTQPGNWDHSQNYYGHNFKLRHWYWRIGLLLFPSLMKLCEERCCCDILEI